MLNPNHPDDARLSALASNDADAVADASLASHLESCVRCATLTEELGALRANLAALPDLAPPRPLRLVPDAVAAPDRLGVWVRKVFGPVMAAGAALALVGMVGTVGPSLYQSAGADSQALDAASDRVAAAERTSAAPAAGGPENFYSEGAPRDASEDGTGEPSDTDEGAGESAALRADAERSPWPMVLFTGVALLVAAGLLRWIVVPRAG